MVSVNTGMVNITEVAISPVTSRHESAVKVNTTESVLNDQLASVGQHRLLDLERSNVVDMHWTVLDNLDHTGWHMDGTDWMLMWIVLDWHMHDWLW